MTTLLIYLTFTVGISFMCSILEAVLLSTTFTYIDTLVKNGVKGSNNLKWVKMNLEMSISSILTLNTIANTFGASAVGAQALWLFNQSDPANAELYVMYFSMGLTILILYFSEITPKTIGATYWQTLAIPASYVIRIVIYVSYPFSFLAIKMTKFLSKNRPTSELSKDEILTVIDNGAETGSISEKERDIAKNLFRLKNIKTRDVLTPRKVVFALDKDLTIDEVLADHSNLKKLKHFSRIPIFATSRDYIQGIVFSQAIFEESNSEHGSKKLSEIAIPVFEINENINLSKALDLFIQRKEHMFIVKDGYDQTAGVVTLEDVFETLLGREIMDELDTIEDMQKFAKNPDHTNNNNYLKKEKGKLN